jgi:hypothetical protein
MSIATANPGRNLLVGQCGDRLSERRPAILPFTGVDIMPFKVADPHSVIAAPIEPVDRANAIRLLKALVAAGENSNTLIVGAWLYDIALKLSLRGTELASALAYAEGQGWIADGPQKGWNTITHAGERAAEPYVVAASFSQRASAAVPY